MRALARLGAAGNGLARGADDFAERALAKRGHRSHIWGMATPYTFSFHTAHLIWGMALLALSACAPVRPPVVPTPPAAAARASLPAPAATGAEEPHPSWEDAAASPGDWTYDVREGQSRARFGGAAGQPALLMRCDPATARLSLELQAIAAPLAGGTITVRTTTMERVLSAQPLSPPQSGLVAILAGRDSLLDAMAFSRGKIVIDGGGAAPLIVPTWAELSRIIEDCRADAGSSSPKL